MGGESEDLGSLVELYALGELEEDKVRLVEDYLQRNPQAREELEEVRKIMAAVAEEPSVEPSPELSAATREKVHSLMAKRRERAAMSFRELAAAFFRKPAYAAAAAVVILGMCVAAYFSLRGPSQLDFVQTDEPGVIAIGKGGTIDEQFSKYVSHSAEEFKAVIQKDALEIEQMFEGRDLTIDIGRAMELLEKEQVNQNPDRSSLVSDIEAVWRDLNRFVEEQEDGMAEEAKRKISEKRIIERAHGIDDAN